MCKAILLTGHPGCGKTTAIKRVVAQMRHPVGGFYTEEIRSQQGARTGFKIVTLDGQEGVLASVNLQSRYRVGRYGVDVAVMDSLAVDSIRRAANDKRLVVIDEIGPMELFSDAFRQAVMDILQSDHCVLATVVRRRHPVADQIKALPNVTLIEITPENRDTIFDLILNKVDGCFL